MRLVLDTNIVVSGLIWGGVPRQLLDMARDKHVTLLTNSALLDELADVFGRGKFAALRGQCRQCSKLIFDHGFTRHQVVFAGNGPMRVSGVPSKLK